MSSKVQLVELTTKIGSGSTPRGGKQSYLENGLYKLIRSQNIYNHYFSEDGLAYISEEQALKLNNVELMKDDILINITGDSVARATIVNEKMLPARVNQHVSIIRCNNEKLYPHYLLSVLTSNEMQRHLLSLAQVGGTRAALTKGMLEKLEIDIVSMKEQRYIGDVLRSINTKIETNQNVIHLLEKTSQTLFKNWFNDFEFPNEEGLPYKSSGGKMVDSELGEIPAAWKISYLDKIANYKNGLAMQKYRPLEDEEDSLPVLKIKELNQGYTDNNSDRCSSSIIEEVKVYDGDVVFSWSGTLLVKLWTGGNAGLNQHLFKVTSNEFEKWFYYLWTNYHLEKFKAIAADKATTMGHIKRTHLSESGVLIAEKKVMDLATRILNPLLEQLVALGVENKKLSELRETLLPKLISGEIDIPEESVVV